MDAELVQRMANLFSGYELFHGRYEIMSTNRVKNKKEGRAKTVTGPAGEVEWREHLLGTGPGVGVIPLLESNSVRWAALDIDIYNLDIPKVETQFKEENLPVVVCRSKSGGAHVYLFLSEPIHSEEVQEMLSSWASALGYGGREIFPKQTERTSKRDIGNWLNMPYFYAQDTMRYGIKDGRPLTLEEFLDYAESQKITLEQFANLPTMQPKKVEDDPDSLFFKGPPCLMQIEARGGSGEGSRNELMFNVGLYLKKRYPDDYENQLQKYNVAMCDPLLSVSELQTLGRTISKKDYAYKCNQSPIKEFCNRRKCYSQEFGVGSSQYSDGAVQISNITKYLGDPVIYALEVEGQRMELTFEQLLRQSTFQARCADLISRVPNAMPQPRWTQYLDQQIRNAEVVETPEEATPHGQLRGLIDQWATGNAVAVDRDEILANAPWNNGEGQILFRLRGLQDYLQLHKFTFPSVNHLCRLLRKLGAEHTDISVKGRKTAVWAVPEPKHLDESVQDTEIPDFGTTEF